MQDKGFFSHFAAFRTQCNIRSFDVSSLFTNVPLDETMCCYGILMYLCTPRMFDLFFGRHSTLHLETE